MKIPSFLKIIGHRIGLLLCFYTITRLQFFVSNWSLFYGLPFLELLQAFVFGLRFDLAGILFTNILFIVFWMIPGNGWKVPWLVSAERLLFVLWNGFFLGLNIADSEFVKFIGKRLSSEYFLLHQDVEEHVSSILITYWPLVLLWSVFVFGLYFFCKPFTKDSLEGVQTLKIFLKGSCARLAIIIMVVVGMRGGFQLKPLHPMHAYFGSSQELGLLTLNTPFNLLKSRPVGEITTERYFSTDEEVVRRLKKMTDLTRQPLGVLKGFNVVVILLESFSLEFIGAANDYEGYTPFFDSLTKQSLFFKFNFANARRSIEGVPAVLCSLPALMGESIIMSNFSNNRLDCLPKVLKEQDYQTYFLHGAHNGSMHFDTFSQLSGFGSFVGLNEFPSHHPENFDQAWGVLDEPMLQYAAQVLNQAVKPVFLSLFTLSSHHPYYIPPHLRGHFKKGTLEIHESIGYTDYALQKFFETAQKQPWFKKTIFILTADHTQKSEYKKYQDLIGYYRVPLLIYVPGWTDRASLLTQEKRVLETRITQHIDIMPSILDLLGVSQKERLLLGQSVFDKGQSGRAYNYTGYGYWYLDPNLLVQYDRKGTHSRAYRHEQTYHLIPESWTSEQVRNLPETLNVLAAAHYFNMGLINNSLYSWKKDLKEDIRNPSTAHKK